MRAFLANSMVGYGFLLEDSFHRYSGKSSEGLRELSVGGGSPHGEIGRRSLYFALCLFIYLFIYSFIYLLSVYLLFIYIFTFYLI